jgi:hypothetical protein
LYPEVFNGITLGGVYIHEPGALISNILIALLSLVLVMAIKKPLDPFQKYWTLFIAFIGCSALGGVLTHGFPQVLGQEGFYYTWAIKNTFIPAANFCAGYITLAIALPRWRTQLQRFLLAKAILISILLFYYYNFIPAVIDLGFTYILVLVFARRLRKTNGNFHPIFLAFLVALLSGPLYLIKYDIDPLW